MSSWHSYPSSYNLGHRFIKDLLTVPVDVEEKVDGSQFSFGIFPLSMVHPEGVGHNIQELRIKSKSQEIDSAKPEGMFKRAVETVNRLAPQLTPGWTYRGEVLDKARHNVLAYNRVPDGNFILFDVQTSETEWLNYEQKKREAERLGFEVVPLLFSGNPSKEILDSLFEKESILGGQRIEGMVIKPIGRTLRQIDGKPLIGKYVSPDFKEVHTLKAQAAPRDPIASVVAAKYRTEARWSKAAQHLREKGLLTDSPKDIGPLVREVQQDVLAEHLQDIKDELWTLAEKDFSKNIVDGLAVWYKQQLANGVQ